MAPLGASTLAPYLRLWQTKHDTGPSQLPLVLLLVVSATGALWLAGSGGPVYIEDRWAPLPSGAQQCSAVVDNAYQQVQLLEQGAAVHKGGMCMRFAASFPSKGGVGCACPCDPNALEHTALTLTVLPAEGWPWQLQKKLTAVSKLVKQWVRRTPRPKTMKRWKREDAVWPTTNHSLSLHTFCCVPAQEYARLVQEDVEQWQRRWPTTHTVEFDRVGCAVTDDEGHVALTLRLTPTSIDMLHALTVEMQLRLGQQHPQPHTPPAEQDAPSLLLATLPPHMPCQRLVDEINARWAPGRWHTPVVLSAAPRCDTCALTAAFHLDGSTTIPAAPPPPSSPPGYVAHVGSIPLVGFSSLSHDVPPSSAADHPLRRRFSADP